MADVFEDRRDLDIHRARLASMIDQTPHLDWLLLTKRPDVMLRLWPFVGEPRANVWAGVTVENQAAADERIPILLQVPARVRFLSVEPMIERIDLTRFKVKPGSAASIDWVIVGGESGPGARPFDIGWARSIIDQCARAGVACFVKQLGARPVNDQPAFTAAMSGPAWLKHDGGPIDLRGVIKDRKGGDWKEWADDLRVREFPRGFVLVADLAWSSALVLLLAWFFTFAVSLLVAHDEHAADVEHAQLEQCIDIAERFDALAHKCIGTLHECREVLEDSACACFVPDAIEVRR